MTIMEGKQMREIFVADDGTIFETEQECKAYESVTKRNQTFHKSRFFSAYGSEYKTYETIGVSVIYIHQDEFEEMEAFLRTKNRDIKSVSSSHIYYLSCMSFYPIEDIIEKEKKVLQNQEKKIAGLEKLKKYVFEQTR